nr:expressed protein [Hymenolepis microstoma]
MIMSLAVFPACYWAYGFMKRAKAKRLEMEAVNGPQFMKPFPRDIRPLPWGDGQTPFFQSMKRYWGFEEHKHD